MEKTSTLPVLSCTAITLELALPAEKKSRTLPLLKLTKLIGKDLWHHQPTITKETKTNNDKNEEDGLLDHSVMQTYTWDSVSGSTERSDKIECLS